MAKGGDSVSRKLKVTHQQDAAVVWRRERAKESANKRRDLVDRKTIMICHQQLLKGRNLLRQAWEIN